MLLLRCFEEGNKWFFDENNLQEILLYEWSFGHNFKPFLFYSIFHFRQQTRITYTNIWRVETSAHGVPMVSLTTLRLQVLP